MPDVLAPNVDNYTRGGTAVYMKFTGSAAFRDVGNIPDFSMKTIATFLEHKTSRDGTIKTDRREITEQGLSFGVSIDEYNAANIGMVTNADDAAAFSQSSATASTLAIATPTLGLDYEIGKYRITALVVKVGLTTKTLGTDYTVDTELGMIRFLPTGTILSSDTVDLTFNVPAIAGNVVSPLSNEGIRRGAIRIRLKTSDGRMWVYTHTKASLGFEGDSTFSGSEFAKTSGTISIEPDYTQTDVWGKLIMLPAA